MILAVGRKLAETTDPSSEQSILGRSALAITRIHSVENVVFEESRAQSYANIVVSNVPERHCRLASTWELFVDLIQSLSDFRERWYNVCDTHEASS